MKWLCGGLLRWVPCIRNLYFIFPFLILIDPVARLVLIKHAFEEIIINQSSCFNSILHIFLMCTISVNEKLRWPSNLSACTAFKVFVKKVFVSFYIGGVLQANLHLVAYSLKVFEFFFSVLWNSSLIELAQHGTNTRTRTRHYQIFLGPDLGYL